VKSSVRKISLSFLFGALLDCVLFAGVVHVESPVYSMGAYNPASPAASTYVTKEKQLAFRGITLAELKARIDDGYVIFGNLCGGFYGEYEKNIGSFYNLHCYPQSGTIEKIVGNFSYYSKSYEKAVCVELTNGEDGVYVKGLKGVYQDNVSSAGFRFITLDDQGNPVYDGSRDQAGVRLFDVATGWSDGAYGVCGVQYAKFVSADSPSLIWSGITLDDLKSASFSGFFGGAAVPKGLPAQGYNKVVVTDAAGGITEMVAEFQVSYADKIRCVVVTFTNGPGGVYAQAVASRSEELSVGLGHVFTNPDRTFNGVAETFASDYAMTGENWNTRQGVYGLVASHTKAYESTGFISTTARLLYPGITLDDLHGCYFGGTFDGAYVTRGEGVGFVRRVTRDSRGAVDSMVVEFQEYTGTGSQALVRCLRVTFSNGVDGVYGKSDPKAYFVYKDCVNHVFGTDSNEKPTTVVTAANGAGYGLRDIFAAPYMKLERDEEWLSGPVGLGGAVVDLNGHNLTVRGITTDGKHVTIVNSETNDLSTLEFAVPAGVSSSLAGVFVGRPYIRSGKVKVVKSGAGTLISPAEQSYTGGTEIVGGVFAYNAWYSLGASGNTVLVAEGATMELSGGGLDIYDLKLAGGTLQVKKAAPENYAQLGNLTLLKPSTFNVREHYGFVATGYGPTTLDLGGNLFTVSLGPGNFFYLYNLTITNGKIDITYGGTAWIAKEAVVATSVDFKVNCALRVEAPFAVRDYESVYTFNYNWGTYPVSVHGTFRPTTQYYHGCEMQNGSTIDMTAWPASFGWPMRSRFDSAAVDIRFAPGTSAKPNVVTVKLDMSRRDMMELARERGDVGTDDGYLLKWDGVSAVRPNNVIFELDGESQARYGLVNNDTGLMLCRKNGFLLILR
jgi:hypothetical protein